MNRHYLTKLAAIKAEARALIIKKHPSEASEDDTGYEGWYWRKIKRSDVLYRRVTRMVKNASFPNAKLTGGPSGPSG